MAGRGTLVGELAGKQRAAPAFPSGHCPPEPEGWLQAQMNARKWSSSPGISSLWVSPARGWTEGLLVQTKDSPLLLAAGPGVPSLGLW